MSGIKYKCLLLGGSLLIVAGVILGVKLVLPLVSPFVLAFFLAVAIEKPVSLLAKKLPVGGRMLSAVIFATFFLIILALVLGVAGYYILGELRGLFSHYDYYRWRYDCELRSLCGRVDRLLLAGSDATYGVVGGYMENVLGWLKTGNTLSMAAKWVYRAGFFAAGFLVMVISLVYMSRELEMYRKIKEESPFSWELGLVYGELRQLFRVYFGTQLVIMLCTGVICTAGLLLIGNPYGVMLGLLIGVLDALPLIGTGTVLIPWSIWLLIKGKMFSAAVLVTVYVITYILREVMEGKLMGDRLSVSPVAMIAAIYVGILLFGLWGILLGPVCLSLCRSLIHVLKTYLKGGKISTK
jgi:sporulation integral membrane protein YtvI